VRLIEEQISAYEREGFLFLPNYYTGTRRPSYLGWTTPCCPAFRVLGEVRHLFRITS
jgi:hypothetical protein